VPVAKVPKPEYADVEVLPKEGAGAKTRTGDPDPLILLVSRLLDTIFRVPGTRIRFGLEPIIGLVPVLGDQVATLISAALLFRSLQHGLPKIALVRMGLNVALAGLIGMIPIIGDVFVLWYKPNIRNCRVLQRYMGHAQTSSRADWLFVSWIVGVTFFLMTVVGALLTYAVISALQRPF
jgi:hypothetical protein